MASSHRALQETALRYFLAVIRWGSISEASTHLNVAASAISRQITRLETELDTQLFERRARGMIPSAAGELLALHARRQQLESERVVGEIQGLRGLQRGTVRLASSEGFAVDFLPKAIAEFRHAYAGILFRLNVASPAEVTRQVREGEVDIGLTFSLAPQPDVRVEHRQRSPILALMSPDHPLAGRQQLKLAQLQPHAMLLPPPETTLRQLFDICCGQQNLIFASVFTSNYIESMLNCAIFGGGIALAGELSIRQRLAQQRLVAIPIVDAGMDARHIEVQTLTNRTLPAATAAFVAHLKQAMAAPA
ncbi:LysR family transcriptional regulator [Salinicola sp. JS01]|uniref:LysR family transcriptional regulator n=1 Tax=Salinicola sp. JS01 TaxID=3050071 RepID=UPI00255BC616|nr:LysR family transcriptional regulator [Salinicola sp. JS01]WIX31797.1 LysR family transcriptional regulator [Salinicola sp. JS01]